MHAAIARAPLAARPGLWLLHGRSGSGRAPHSLLLCSGYALHQPRTMNAASRQGAANAPDAARTERDRQLAALLAEAARGDSSAFEAFYDATVAYARTLARRMLHGVDTDDLLADAYFEAWRHAARFDAARGGAVTWLLTIVRSRALDLLRHRNAYPSVAGTDAAEVDMPGDASDDPAERLWREQADSRLHAALERLTAPERWVLGLAYFRELTHHEIAQCTGMPLGTVKSHVQRAQTKLRAALAT